MSIRDPYQNFEEALINVIAEMRAKFASHDIGNLSLMITIGGRVETGEISVTFHVADYSYSDDQTKGGELKYVVDEFLRRREWSERNNALMLPNSATTKYLTKY